MTVRLWARTPEEAELISPAAVPDLSVETVAGLIPFTTEDPILRCLDCDRLLTAAEYASPSHLCPIRAWPASEVDDDDISVDTRGLLRAFGVLAALLAFDAVLLIGIIAAGAAVIRWAFTR